MSQRTDDEKLESRKAFEEAVNMSPSEIEDWLKIEDSRSVGAKDSEGAESTGHASGRRIARIKRKTVDQLGDDDYDHMDKVVGYVHRHKTQGGPAEDKEHSAWRYSLKNWGHDPLK